MGRDLQLQGPDPVESDYTTADDALKSRRSPHSHALAPLPWLT